MNRSRLIFSLFCVLTLATLPACTLLSPVALGVPPMSTTPQGTQGNTLLPASAAPVTAVPATAISTAVAPANAPLETIPASQEPAVLLFGIGMHIEPFGAAPSSIVGINLPALVKKGDYNQQPFFNRHVKDIHRVVEIVERHGGRLTVQAQTPFTQVAAKAGNTLLADLAAAGHEIALHFHEDAHLGQNSEKLSVETWCAVMKEEIALLSQASRGAQVRFWSGGNLYPDLFEAAACAGLEINSDWKNPRTQTTPLELTGIHPWRPSGGTDGVSLEQIIQHDPLGKIIYLPEGLFERNDFASMRRSQAPDGDQAYFDFLATSLHDSLTAAQPGQVNVFHFTVHPAEFRGEPAHPFSVIERFLNEVVDPLITSGQLRWATFSEMADAYQTWEQAHPGLDPRTATIPDQELLVEH